MTVKYLRKRDVTYFTELELGKLHDSAKTKRLIHEPELIDSYLYAYPQRKFRQDLRMRDNPVDRKFIYDSTAGLGVRNLATWTMRRLLPQEMKFARIVVRNDIKNRKALARRLKLQLDDSNEQLHDHFKYRNFYQTTWEVLKDGIVGGTMAVMIEDIPGLPIRYTPIPIDELYFLESYRGEIDCVFRDHMVTGRQMQQEGWDLPRELKQQVENDPTASHRCTEAIIPDGRKFQHLIWYGRSKRCRVIHKGRMQFNPYIITRWERILGQPWGNRPTRAALPSIRTLNQIVRDALVFGAIASHGCWIIKGEYGDSRYIQDFAEPGVAIHLDQNTEISALPMPGNPNLNFQLQDRARQEVNNHMLNMTLPDNDKVAYMKAETAQLLKSQWERQIGEPALRLQREYLRPIAEQTAMRLFQRGELRVLQADQLGMFKARNQAQTLEKVFRMDTNAMLRMLQARQRGRDRMRAYQAGVATFGPEIIAGITDTVTLAKDTMQDIGLAKKYLLDKPEALDFKSRRTSLNRALSQSRTAPVS